MIRVLLVVVILMALPVGIYIVWRVFLSPAARAGQVDSVDPETLPWKWLLPIGGVLSLIAIILLGDGLLKGGKEDVYEPPRVVDGKIIPGKLRPKKTADDK